MLKKKQKIMAKLEKAKTPIGDPQNSAIDKNANTFENILPKETQEVELLRQKFAFLTN